MQPKVLKYILDIESAIVELETVKSHSGNSFLEFKANIILLRAAERDLEIIGEAVKKIIEIQPNAQITSSRNIIGLRNLISHAYDSIEPEIIWGIISKDIPLLSIEIDRLKNN